MPFLRTDYLIKANRLQGKKSIHFTWDGKEIKWPSGITASIEIVNQESDGNLKRDEDYVIHLCDIILKDKALHQFRFDFLCGDSGIKLPVDAYYKDLNLVIEYYEKQHTESVPIFNKMTVSGVPRDE